MMRETASAKAAVPQKQVIHEAPVKFRSGKHTAIVKEKDAAAYRSLVNQRAMEPERTWMIGNSPKSDINPALEAGLNAVFVPHRHTWVLEKQELRPGAGKLLVLEGFRELKEHF